MAFELRGFLTGIALELSANPLFLDTSKKIVAYSYNGTVLPKLPEWDRERYPYAAITDESTLFGYFPHHLMICAAPFCVFTNKDLNVTHISGTAEGAPLLRYEYNSESDTWEIFKYPSSDSQVWEPRNSFTYPIWTNTDIASRDDGTLYLAASEPVPVYE